MSTLTAPLWYSTDFDELMHEAKKRYEITFMPVEAGSATLHIAQIDNMQAILSPLLQKDTLKDAVRTLPFWAKVWPASIIAGLYLCQMPHKTMPTLEIGAGCGVTSLIAAAHGFTDVTLSDVNEDALLFARINILKNNLQDNVRVEKIDISHDVAPRKYPFIFGSEILYLQELYPALLRFLVATLAPIDALNQEPHVLLASDGRRAVQTFFVEAQNNFTALHKKIGMKEKAHVENPEKYLLLLHKLLPILHK